jgi:hypothetical protein
MLTTILWFAMVAALSMLCGQSLFLRLSPLALVFLMVQRCVFQATPATNVAAGASATQMPHKTSTRSAKHFSMGWMLVLTIVLQKFLVQGNSMKKPPTEPERCWQCNKLLRHDQQFFCSITHGYTWAVLSAQKLALVKAQARKRGIHFIR